ncbi:MAG: ABC transporter permease [Blastocatellia bacterium]|nr:ABC transporter permease [Blastocatellia bacterium]
MMRHIWKLVWNRKRANALIVIEILASFLVLYAVTLVGVYFAHNYRQPLGFSYDRVWLVEIDWQRESIELQPELEEEKEAAMMRQLLTAVKEFPEVESAAAMSVVPYSNSTYSSGFTWKGRQVEFMFNRGTTDTAQVLDMHLTAGRWFTEADAAGSSFRPVVINRRLARELFGTENPLGQVVKEEQDKVERRVIGVLEDFRKDGEFSGLQSYMFEHATLGKSKGGQPNNFVLRVRPGVTAAFEEKLTGKLRSMAPTWGFEVKPIEQMRESTLLWQLIPLTIFGVIVGFLLIMVSLGLLGVLWQNVTQRTKEIGLRRALGATAGEVYAQIVSELLVVSTFGLSLGILAVIQFPLLKVVDFISPTVYFTSLVISLGIVYGLTVLCGLYPGWLATRVQPSEALHYE